MTLVPSKSLRFGLGEQIASCLSSNSPAQGLSSNSPAQGLALLIGCKSSFHCKHSTLMGVQRDLELLRETFFQLGFHTVELLDPTRDEIIKAMESIKENLSVPKEQCCNIPRSCCHIVITFSGHGDQTEVFSRTGSLNIMKDIVNPLVSTNPFVSKLFFIDACRGDQIDPGIGFDIHDFVDGASNRIVARGAEEVRLPSKGNYLLAFSTLPGMKSFEDCERGSFWMQLLSKALLENNNKSILDLLTSVNQNIIVKFNEMDRPLLQQPILMSCLNMDIKLRPRKIDDLNKMQLQSVSLSPEDEGILQRQKSLPSMPDINVKVQIPTRTTDNQQSYYRIVLNLFRQKGIIVKQEEPKFEKNPNNDQQYKCTITAELRNKCKIIGNSQYLFKKPTEEAASKDIFLAIKPCLSNLSFDDSRESLVSQPPSSASSGTPLPSKTFKTRLKEYCDKKWKGSEVLYDTKHDEYGFFTTVTLPDKQKATGEVQANKKEAENSAAKAMLTCLDI